MQVPIEISYRNVAKSDALRTQIDRETQELERICNYITSCRIAMEKPHEHQRTGNPYRVRIDVRVPPNHELVATHESQHGEMHEPLNAVVGQTFSAVRRQLQKLVELQRKEVKTHPEQIAAAIVRKLVPEANYGFLKTIEGEEIYFHKNSVLQHQFDRLAVGTQVRYVAELGEKGLQATTVQMMDKPGTSTGSAEAQELQPTPELS